ncbi:MAG: radical SAM protein [Nitrospinota bacterium]
MNLPYHAHIEPTTYCDLKCENCINDTVPSGRIGHLSIDTLKDILSWMPFIKDISLLGLGEPLMNPEILNMLSLIKSRNIVCRIATNGMLLNRIDMERLLNSLDQCIISFHAVTKTTFEEIRRGSDFDKVIQNVKDMVTMRDRKKILTKIFLHTIITKRNLSEVLDIPEIAVELGVDKVRFVMAVQYIPENLISASSPFFYNSTKMANLLVNDGNIERDLANKLSDKCRRYGLDFSFTSSEKKFSSCWWPKGGIFVTYDGFITPCCLRMDPSVYNFGNIFKDSVDEILSGEKYQDFRRDFREGRVPDICSNCPS